MALTLLAAGKHLLVEKPLALDIELVPATRKALAQAHVFLGVAYVYHFMPWAAEARHFLQTGILGRVLQASVVCGQHFPTFRPAYREIYYARHEQGGGAIQDALTHVANAIEWLIDSYTRLCRDTAHQMLERVSAEDTVNVCARLAHVLATLMLNQFQAPNEVTFDIHGENGSLKIEGHRRRWGILLHGDADWTWHETPLLERDDLFIAQASAFLDGLEGKAAALCTFEEDVRTLKFNQARLALC